MQSNKFGLVGLGSLTDLRKSIGTEDGGGVGNDDIRSMMLMVTDFWGVETRGAGPEGLCGFDKTMARG